MTKTAFNRDDVLSAAERNRSATKCLSLLEGNEAKMTDRERDFVENMGAREEFSERQLAWLRDLVEKYAQ